ncbi:hypothetical protein D3C75_752550 [compost metagenome]
MQCQLTGGVVAKRYMLEGDRRSLLISPGKRVLSGIRNGGFSIQHFIHTIRRGRGLGENNNQIRDYNQRQQNLGHIIDKSNNFPLGQPSRINMDAACPQNGNNCGVDHQRCHRSQPCGDAGDTDCRRCEILRSGIKAPLLTSALGKGADHADAGQVLAEHKRQMIQLLLVFAVERRAACDDEIQNHTKYRSRREQNQREPEIENHGHDNRTDTDERSADDQTDQHCHSELQLVHIIRDPVDQRRRPKGIQLGIGERRDMLEHLIAQGSAEALRSPGGIILAHHGTAEAKQ